MTKIGGMPSNKALRREAGQLAGAGLPSKRSLRRQYHRAQTDAGGFTSALVSLLKGEQGTAGQAYGQAVAQQQQIDDAARQQLGNLGEQYGAGSAAKVGASGDSAVSSLLSGQAAASDYASRQPGIAAGRGALAQTALENALQDALSQRADQYKSAFGPAYQSVKQNAFNETMALKNFGLSQQQLSLSQQQLALSAQGQSFSEAEQLRHDATSANQFSSEMIARYGYNPATGKFVQSQQAGSTVQGLAHKYGLTPNEIIGLQGHTVTQVQSLLAQGTNWKRAIAMAEGNGVPPEIARFAVMSVYSNPPKPPAKPQKPAPKAFADSAHYQQALAQWQQQVQTWQQNMTAFNAALRGFNVQVIWRQLQHRHDATLHPPTTSTEH